MATERQLTANRKNSELSTGPRSLAGKTRSRMNAVRHGLTANQGLLPGEDPKEFDALRYGTFAALRPDGVLENQLVERIVSLIWRMRRVQVFEAALMEFIAYQQAQMWDGPDPELLLSNDPDNLQPLHELEDPLKLGRVIDVMVSNDMTGKLSRYETAMQKQLSATLKELREIVKARPVYANPSLPNGIVRAHDSTANDQFRKTRS